MPTQHNGSALTIGRAELAPGLVHQDHDAIDVEQRDVAGRAIEEGLEIKQHSALS